MYWHEQCSLSSGRFISSDLYDMTTFNRYSLVLMHEPHAQAEASNQLPFFPVAGRVGHWLTTLTLNQKVWGLVLLNALLWTLIPWFTDHNLPLDAVEQVIWGQQWQWGYYKHPFLPAWMAQVFWLAFSNLGIYFLSQLAILVTLFFVYLLGRSLLGHERALLGSLLTLGIYYFIWPTPEWNNNISQMPFWAAAVYFFKLALDGGRYKDWMLTGVALGLGMLTKYSTVMLIATMFLYVLYCTDCRKHLATKQLWLGVVSMILVFMPNLIWVIQHDFMPLTYAVDRSDEMERSGWLNLLLGLRFLLVQLIDHLPMILILAAAGLMAKRFWSLRASSITTLQFLLFMGLGPAFLTVLGAWLTGSGLRDMWGTPMWNLSGLIAAAFLWPLSTNQWRRLLRSAAGFIITVSSLGLANNLILSHYTHKPGRTQWPDRAMATDLDSQWQKYTHKSLHLIAGDSWVAGLVALHTQGHPSVFIEGDRRFSPWVTSTEIKHDGVLLLWSGEVAQEPTELKSLGSPLVTGHSSYPWPESSRRPLSISWAIIAPEPIL